MKSLSQLLDELISWANNPYLSLVEGSQEEKEIVEPLRQALNDYENIKDCNVKVEDSNEKIKAFNLVVEYEINIRFFKYCCDKRRGLQIFNQGRLGAKKLKYEDYEFLRKVIYEKN